MIDLTAAREALAKARLSPSSSWVEIALGLLGDALLEIEKLRPYKWPSECSTCHRSYLKGEMTVCSNAFHCCRDCRWVEGRLTAFCAEHVEREFVAKIRAERDEGRLLVIDSRGLIDDAASPVATQKLREAVASWGPREKWDAEKASGE